MAQSAQEAALIAMMNRNYGESDPMSRARILAMSPEARADLATFIRQQYDGLPARIAKLEEDQRVLAAWLAEFAPELAPATPSVDMPSSFMPGWWVPEKRARKEADR